MNENGLTYGEALAALMQGKRLARAGWNGRGMWIAYMPGVVIPATFVNGRTLEYVTREALERMGGLRVGAYLAMWTADGTWLPGWLASQTDMLTADWYVVPGKLGEAMSTEDL